jgi:aminopeptidase N
MLGDDVFRASLHGFMDRWHGKHPIPWDFFNTVNDISGRNLNWFFNSWYFQHSYIDIGIASVAKARNGYSLVLTNIGGMPAPVDLKLAYTDGTSATVHQTSGLWQPNQQRATITLPTKKRLQSVALDHSIWVDADSTNDVWPAHPSATH